MGVKFQEMFRRYVFKVVVITKKMFGGNTENSIWFKREGNPRHYNQWCGSGNVCIQKTKEHCGYSRSLL